MTARKKSLVAQIRIGFRDYPQHPFRAIGRELTELAEGVSSGAKSRNRGGKNKNKKNYSEIVVPEQHPTPCPVHDDTHSETSVPQNGISWLIIVHVTTTCGRVYPAVILRVRPVRKKVTDL